MPDNTCPSCGQAFASQREADDHAKQMHSDRKGGEREDPERQDLPPIE